jgi:glycosyl transferase family 25
MQAFLDSEHGFALILEDDVKPTAALPEVLQRLMTAHARWDMVKLSAIHSGTPLGVLPLGPSHRLGVMFSRCTGSSAYVVNRSSAQRYVEQLLPMQLPYDHAYDRGWVYGLKVRRVFPEVCVHDDQVESMIGNPGPSRKFAWHRRWPTYEHRMHTELRRLSHGLAQALWHRV